MNKVLLLFVFSSFYTSDLIREWITPAHCTLHVLVLIRFRSVNGRQSEKRLIVVYELEQKRIVVVKGA